MGVTAELATFISGLRYESLPPAVVQAAKIAIIDGVANMVAGSAQPFAHTIGQYTRDMGGAPKSSVVGWGFKTNPPAAAFANGVFGHCLDFEIQGYPPTHGTSSCLPAALALAEANDAPGKAVITAYVLGWEIQGRLRTASAPHTAHAYHPPGLVGPLGGAAASASVLGLDPQQTSMALGIAASRTGGLTANTGTMVKSTHPGNAARMGAEAALLAGAGYTSSDQALESETGYAQALFGRQLDWQAVTSGLGETYRLLDPGFDIKRFPAQIYMQRPIEAVLNLREAHAIDPSQLRTLTITGPHRSHSGPLPRSGLDGKFSIQYCAAIALLDGQVGIDSFTDDRRFSPDVEELLPKLRLETLQTDTATAIAEMSDGRTLQGQCRDFRGSAANPMDHEERTAKFHACASRVLSDSKCADLLTILQALEQQPSVRPLMDLLRG